MIKVYGRGYGGGTTTKPCTFIRGYNYVINYVMNCVTNYEINYKLSYLWKIWEYFSEHLQSAFSAHLMFKLQLTDIKLQKILHFLPEWIIQ
jgi:hypothetical protein